MKLIVPHFVRSMLSLIATFSIGTLTASSDFFSFFGISSSKSSSDASSPSTLSRESFGLSVTTLGQEILTPTFFTKSILSP